MIDILAYSLLIDLVSSPSSSAFTKNFALAFLDLGVPRLVANDDKTQVALHLMRVKGGREDKQTHRQTGRPVVVM